MDYKDEALINRNFSRIQDTMKAQDEKIQDLISRIEYLENACFSCLGTKGSEAKIDGHMIFYECCACKGSGQR